MEIESADGRVILDGRRYTLHETWALLKRIKAAIAKAKLTHCPHGHKIHEEDYRLLKNGYMARRCPVCQKQQHKVYYEKAGPRKRADARRRYHANKETHAGDTQ